MSHIIAPKKFLLIFLSLLTVFSLYHLVVWNFLTTQIFNREDGKYVGDLGRLSYQINSLYPRKLEYTMENKFLTTVENKTIGIITVGDSFSNAAMGGKNPYYQDYLGNKYNKSILNIKEQNKNHNPLKSILHLYNIGWLETHKPDAIIIESVERLAVMRFAKDFNFEEIGAKVEESMIQEKVTNDSYIPILTTVNPANYKIPFYTLKYIFKNNAVKDIYKFELSKDVFSTPDYKSSLLVIDQDLKNIKSNNLESILKINDNFNKLALLLKKLNIKLFFMPAVDKYDFYFKILKDRNLPKNNFFDIIRPLKKEYYFVDTKKILTNLLDNNVKDIFYSDDTHWSYKASEAISKDKIFADNL